MPERIIITVVVAAVVVVVVILLLVTSLSICLECSKCAMFYGM